MQGRGPISADFYALDLGHASPASNRQLANMRAELDQLQAHFDEQQRAVSELRYNNSMLTALNAALGIECQQLRSATCAAAYAQAANAMHLRILLPCAPCSRAWCLYKG